MSINIIFGLSINKEKGDGLIARYYDDDNASKVEFYPINISEIDEEIINMNWSTLAPESGLEEIFKDVWQGWIEPSYSEEYRFNRSNLNKTKKIEIILPAKNLSDCHKYNYLGVECENKCGEKEICNKVIVQKNNYSNQYKSKKYICYRCVTKPEKKCKKNQFENIKCDNKCNKNEECVGGPNCYSCKTVIKRNKGFLNKIYLKFVESLKIDLSEKIYIENSNLTPNNIKNYCGDKFLFSSIESCDKDSSFECKNNEDCVGCMCIKNIDENTTKSQNNDINNNQNNIDNTNDDNNSEKLENFEENNNNLQIEESNDFDNDIDTDGIPNEIDQCPEYFGSPEFDGCPHPIEDADGDGISDKDDNCPFISNPQQSDLDNDWDLDCVEIGEQDGIHVYINTANNLNLPCGGDVCDLDIDNDNVPNEFDQCPEIEGNDEFGCPIN
jgi:hypothetical protein